MEDFIELEIRAQLKDIEMARRDAEDLAWEHAKTAAQAAGLSIGSEPFEVVFRELQKSYLHMAEYLEFMTFNALVLLRGLLNSGLVQLTAEKPMTDEQVAEILGELSQKAVSSYAWMIAGYDLIWPNNTAMPKIGVTFKFPTTDIITTQEPQ
jgi:hypothetical protein